MRGSGDWLGAWRLVAAGLAMAREARALVRTVENFMLTGSKDWFERQ